MVRTGWEEGVQGAHILQGLGGSFISQELLGKADNPPLSGLCSVRFVFTPGASVHSRSESSSDDARSLARRCWT